MRARAPVKLIAVAFTLVINQPAYPICRSSHMILHEAPSHNTAMKNQGHLILSGFITTKKNVLLSWNYNKDIHVLI